jgi:tRNA threonylcarbamoyladenosine biosynthesis protein TsaE
MMLAESLPPARTVSVALVSAADTRTAGLALGRTLPAQALVLLRGDLGTGKTTLVKATCEALGIAPAVVISPTYTLVNIYPGARTVYHVDLYRLEQPEALTYLDEQDWINPDGPTFIEWPDLAEPLLSGRPALRLSLRHDGLGRHLDAESLSPAYFPALTELATLNNPEGSRDAP